MAVHLLMSGAVEVSYPGNYGPAAVWRSYVKDLPLRDRTGYMRRKGSVVEVDLVALTQKKDKTICRCHCGDQCIRPVQGQKPHELYLHNRLLRSRPRKKRLVKASESGD